MRNYNATSHTGLRWFVIGAGLVAGAAVAERVYRRSRESHDTAGVRRSGNSMNVAAALTVRRSVEDVYGFWRDFKNFPVFMRRLEAVEDIGGGRSRWLVRGPAGVPVEWDAEIISDQPGHMISWRSLPGSSVPNRGAVRFEPAPGARGTEIHVELSYEPPAGSLGAGVAWLFGSSPRQQVREGLRRVKQMLEVGEIPLSERPSASGPAAPPASADELRVLMGVQA